MSPYEREIRLMPTIAKMEQRGVHVNRDLLSDDTNRYFRELNNIDIEIKSMLRRDVDIDSNESLADAIEAAGLSKGFAQTPTGRRSVAKESLIGAIADTRLLGHLLVRGALATCLRTFYQPWQEQCQSHGKLYIKWNQFRNYTDTGARTGRLSSSPNLQNIPTTWEKLVKQLNGISYVPSFPLPQMRSYIIPAPGHVFVGRDYKAQEMRLLAHFAEGGLLELIRANPHEDIHKIAAQLAGISRAEAKTLAFAILYGAGVGRLAESLGISVGAAASIKARYLDRLPEIKRFSKALANETAMGLPIKTLAGRQYYAQAPAVVQGRLKTFEYKLTNYKIQGSAADQTKEAMYKHTQVSKYGHLVLSVHDQLVSEVPEDRLDEERAAMDEAVNTAFQELLKYRVVSDEAVGHHFGALK